MANDFDWRSAAQACRAWASAFYTACREKLSRRQAPGTLAKLARLAPFCCLLLLESCTTTRPAPHAEPVCEQRQTGAASWYGPGLHGRLTANGEIFDQDALTAAHRTLALGSLLEVTNLENGKQIIVRVNDRGPYVDDRIIDLSRAAARALEFTDDGLAEVRLCALPAAPNADVATLRNIATGSLSASR